jgi:hypothetical protein
VYILAGRSAANAEPIPIAATVTAAIDKLTFFMTIPIIVKNPVRLPKVQMTSVNRLRGIQFRGFTVVVKFSCVKQKTQAIAAFLGV